MELNCTFTPDKKDERSVVLHITWDGDSTFKINGAVNMKKGTYYNNNTIVWTRHRGDPTYWVKNGK